MDNKKERIIHAAIELFNQQGIEKTKVSDIVKVAGIAQGTFYLYFPSKLSVMPSIAQVMVEKIISTIEEHVEQEASFSTKLEQMVNVVFSLTKEYRDVFALIYAGLASSEHLQEWEAIYAPYYSWVSQFLLEGQASGTIRDSFDTHRMAKLLIGLIESAAEQMYLYDQSEERTVEQHKKEVLELIHFGLSVQKIG